MVALIGLAINLIVAPAAVAREQNLNTRGALLHVMGDLLGSVAALASRLVITYTGWTPIDPLLTMLIAGLILGSTLNLLRSALRTLMEGVPPGISLPVVGRRLAQEPKGAGDSRPAHLEPRQQAGGAVRPCGTAQSRRLAGAARKPARDPRARVRDQPHHPAAGARGRRPGFAHATQTAFQGSSCSAICRLRGGWHFFNRKRSPINRHDKRHEMHSAQK